jgi:pimeloyl-ACP methyl ester carboxylesterase
VIVGLSMGARNGLYFAARHPELVQALIVTDIGLRVHDKGRKQMAPLFEPPHQLVSQEGFAERIRRAYPQMSEDQVRRAVASNTRRLPNGKWSWRYDIRTIEVLRRFEADHGDEYHRTIRSVRVPTLVVRGVSSDIMTREDATTLASMIPGSRLIEVPNAGHRVMRDNPHGYASIVTEFLGAHGLW